MAQYVITNGKKFIQKDRRGKFVPTSCEALADIFSKKQAETIYQNQIPKTLRSTFYVDKYDIPPNHVKQVTSKDLLHNTEKAVDAENIRKWLDKLSDLNGLEIDALQRKEELIRELSQIDKELTDVNHYIEFCNLNAAQGYKAYKMIKERRIKRRSIKNELNVIGVILGNKISEIANGEVQKCIIGMDNRKYEPRVLKELFDM